jgi:hypothetical protein
MQQSQFVSVGLRGAWEGAAMDLDAPDRFSRYQLEAMAAFGRPFIIGTSRSIVLPLLTLVRRFSSGFAC